MGKPLHFLDGPPFAGGISSHCAAEEHYLFAYSLCSTLLKSFAPLLAFPFFIPFANALD
jgi:hypothetical protein